MVMAAAMANTGQRPPFLPGLGGLRGLAALAVLLGHGLAWLTPLPQTPDLYEPFARLTRCGLSAFFVLSGFVLAYNHGAAMAAGELPFGRFALARLARLYPVYLLTLGLAAGLALLKHGPGSFGGPGHLLAFASLTQTWFLVPGWPQIFPLAWAVSVEVFFYLAFPATAWLLARARTPRAALWLILAPLALALALDGLGARLWPRLFTAYAARHPEWAGTSGELAALLFQWLFYSSPYLRIFEWLMGAAAARLFVLKPRMPHNLDIVAALGLAGLLVAPLPKDNFYLQVIAQNVLYAPLLTALLLAFAARPRAFLSARRLGAISAASLSVYLVQTWTLGVFTGPPETGWPEALLRLAAGLAATLCVGLAVARCIEHPAARWVMAKRPQRPGA
ncbi:acyltransferase [Solidesulfovibrio carbinolicus]|uniref:Acyltransferase n=2 Tax=Solidesulfovibrio carbinolicus TaxID=296842 RepID=A0A4P6HPW0_9BACT|nr:acyltransferase [Solidesulfovibrio carbinolicus]